MPTNTKFDWKLWAGLALGAFAVANTFDHPLASEDGAILLMAILVGLPVWALLKAQHDGFRTGMVATLAFVALITVAPSKPGVGSGDCETEWDGRNNPTVCD